MRAPVSLLFFHESKNGNMTFVLKPIQIFVLYLCAMLLLASASWGSFDLSFWLGQVWHFFLLAIPGLLANFVFFRSAIRKPRWEYHFITISILFLLFDPLLPWWSFLFLGIVAELSRRFVRVATGPIFNPAAFAAVALTFFDLYPGWWGVSFAPRLPIEWGGWSIATLFLTLPVLGFVVQSYKKWRISAMGMSVFALFYLVLLRANPFFLLAEGTLLFFFFAMGSEPKTSPILPKQQYLFGGVLGFLMAVALLFFIDEPYCMPLLACNAVFTLYQNRLLLLRKWKPRVLAWFGAPREPLG